MPTITFDTYAYVKELTSAGFSNEQAEVQVKTLLDALKQIEAHRLDGMASKRDVKEIELKIAEVKRDLELQIAEVKRDLEIKITEFKNDLEIQIVEVKKDLAVKIAEVRKDIDVKIAEVKRDIAETKSSIIKWVIGLLIIQSGILISTFIAITQLLK